MYEEFDANVFNPCPDDRRTIRTASTALEIVLGLVRWSGPFMLRGLVTVVGPVKV